MSKVLFITQTGAQGPAARYRAYDYIPSLERHGIKCRAHPGVPDLIYQWFYSGNQNAVKKLLKGAVVSARRLFSLLLIRNADCVVIQKEILPGFFPLFELLIAKTAKKTIFDFDDAVFLNGIHGMKHFARICGACNTVIAGNEYIASCARRFNKNVFVIPTAIDTERFLPAPTNDPKPHRQSALACSDGAISDQTVRHFLTLGWTGSFSTLPYLEIIKSPLLAAVQSHGASIRVIAHKDGLKDMRKMFSPEFIGAHVDYRMWSLEHEIEHLRGFDIGLAPLPDIEWAKGKCGCKLLQYMAMGIPSIASPAGVHTEIIQHGENGFLASSGKEWTDYIGLLAHDPALRASIGAKARQTVIERYSLGKASGLLAEILI